MNPSAAFQDSAHGLLSWLLDSRSETLDREGAHRPLALAQHLACCYRERGVPPPRGTPLEVTTPPWVAETYLREDRAYRARVAALCGFIQEELGGFLRHAYLHGSLATRDYAPGWSDVDTFLVLRQETVTDDVRLLECRRRCLKAWPFFLAICPLQHHGFIVATEADLSSYSSHYLPPPVLDEALNLLPAQGTIRFHLRSEDAGAMASLRERCSALREAASEGVLRHHPRNGVYLMAGYRNAQDGMQQLFSLLGYAMTVPAYVMDACGRPCYKRESFAAVRPLFSVEAWSLIERASAIRAQWPGREGVAYHGNAIPAWVQAILGPDYFDDALRLLDEAVAAAERRPLVKAV